MADLYGCRYNSPCMCDEELCETAVELADQICNAGGSLACCEVAALIRPEVRVPEFLTVWQDKGAVI